MDQESTPFLTVDDDEAVAKVDCGCQLEATHPPGAVMWLCPVHEAAPDLLEAMEEIVKARGHWEPRAKTREDIARAALKGLRLL